MKLNVKIIVFDRFKNLWMTEGIQTLSDLELTDTAACERESLEKRWYDVDLLCNSLHIRGLFSSAA